MGGKGRKEHLNNAASAIPFVEIIPNIANREGRYAVKEEHRKENKSRDVVLDQQRNRAGL